MPRGSVAGSADSLLAVLPHVRQVTDLSLSFDGTTVAYTLSEVDALKDSQRQTIWICRLGGDEQPRKIAAGSCPRWSPRGDQLVALGPGGTGSRRLVLVKPTDGKVSPVGPERRTVSGLTWSSSGDKIYFAAELDEAVASAQPRVIEAMGFRREGIGFTAEHRTQLFAVDVSSGVTRQLTRGEETSHGPACSPDGSRLAFVRSAPPSRDGSPRSDLWLLDLSTGTETQLTRGLPFVASPSFSPDGRKVAFFANDDASGGEDQRRGLYLVELGTGAWRQLGDPDEAIVLARDAATTAPPLWVDERHLLARVARRGFIHLARFDLAGSRELVVDGPRQVLTYDLRADRLAFVSGDSTDPAVLSWKGADDSEEHHLPTWNGELRESLSVLQIKGRAFQVGSKTIEGWLIRGSDNRGPAPLAVSLHGGPHAYSSPCFSLAHFYRYLLAARGYCVLILNHSGSASYGRSFAEALHGQWGRLDRDEVLACSKALVDSGEAQPGHWGVIGYSYGGFLAARMAADGEQFGAAVIGAPIVAFDSFVGTSDIGAPYLARELDLQPPSPIEAFGNLSPTHAAHQIGAPTLLLHGESDLRCPIGQSEELFAALRTRGRAPVQFVRYPGADHGFPGSGRLSHRVDYHRRIADWLTAHVGAEE